MEGFFALLIGASITSDDQPLPEFFVNQIAPADE
jgi:hypothetical protein